MGVFTATTTRENDLIPTDGLVAWYDAGNPESYPGTGTIWYDLSNNRARGTLVATPTYSLANKYFTFNGTTQYVTIPTFLPAGQPTYSFFSIMTSTNAGTTMVMGQATETTNRRAMLIRIGGNYGFNGYNNDNHTGIAVGNNVLTSFAFTMNTKAVTQSSALTFYRNGARISSGGTTGGATNLNLGVGGARIAANIGNGELFNGSIGVCMAWNRVLSNEEVAQVHQYYGPLYNL